MSNYTEENKKIYNEVCDKYKHHWLDTTITQTMAMEMITKALTISRVSCSLPSKDDISSLGYSNAANGRYNYRRVLRDKEQDVYYSGWMDCVDFLNK